jgi:hypothetical protein
MPGSAPATPPPDAHPVLDDDRPDPVVEATSTEYLGRWNRLVSTTNWEKGRIICQWREALESAGAPASSCTDEAWSRRVGNVSPQHAGRLRRTYQRFGATYEQYLGLYWSHFQVALDWDDAEMWLEGAVQSGWSVAAMREQRWNTLGAPPELKPRDEDMITGELDEDLTPGGEPPLDGAVGESLGEVRAADGDEAGSFDDSAAPADPSAQSDEADPASPEPAPSRPFENVGPLPPDLDEAVESLKLAILNHKIDGWREIRLEQMLGVIEALRQLALAPGE